MNKTFVWADGLPDVVKVPYQVAFVASPDANLGEGEYEIPEFNSFQLYGAKGGLVQAT